MTIKTVKVIAFILLLVHGIGHFQGVVASFGVHINNSNARISWLLKGFGETFNHSVCFILFLLTGVIGIITALVFKGIILQGLNWETLAVVTAICSIFCLVLFPNGFAQFFNKIGAIAVNLVIIYSIILNNNWPTVLFEN